MQGLRGLSPAEAGAALHLVMQNLDLAQVTDQPAIDAQIEGMVSRELLTPEQAGAVEAKKILAFWQSPLGRRILAGKRVLREIPFTLALPAREIYTEIDGQRSEKVIIQGIIDCLIDEGDGLLLLDYKTDRIPRDHPEEAVRRYRRQLDLYARAVESIYGKIVKERYLYLFSLEQEIRCDTLPG
jgi:ATP-dependent helicase/nuclease subunit A